MVLAQMTLVSALFLAPADLPQPTTPGAVCVDSISHGGPGDEVRRLFRQLFGSKRHRPASNGSFQPASPGSNGNRPAPEPASMALLGLGIAGAGAAGRRRKRQARSADQAD